MNKDLLPYKEDKSPFAVHKHGHNVLRILLLAKRKVLFLIIAHLVGRKWDY